MTIATEPRTPFMVHCGTCGHEWALAFLPMEAATFAKFKHARCPMCGGKDVLCIEKPKPTDEGDPIAWLTNGDTGISSKTIWSVMMNRSIGDRYFRPSVPSDPSDFGRCYRLLKVMPSWRARLGEVAAQYPEWAGLVAAWDELTALYEEELPKGTAPKLYQRMQVLRGVSAE